MGLGLYAVGALAFFPAKLTGKLLSVLVGLFCHDLRIVIFWRPAVILISCQWDGRNGYPSFLNLAQAFNPIGSLMGMFVAMNFIQNQLHPMDTAERALLSRAEFEAIRDSDLTILITPYLTIGIVILVMLLVIRMSKMPKNADKSHSIDFIPTLKRLYAVKRYRYGVVAQFFYVGAQIMCWTFIIQYGTRLFMAQGMEEQAAEVLSQKYNIVAMVIFCISRFVCTLMLKYVNPGQLLKVLAIAASLCVLGVIFLQNIYGMYCLVGVSACMSLMFPTIYGIALKGMGDDAKFGAAGLIMAILGGSVLPPLQAAIIDCKTLWGYACSESVVCTSARLFCGYHCIWPQNASGTLKREDNKSFFRILLGKRFVIFDNFVAVLNKVPIFAHISPTTDE